MQPAATGCNGLQPESAAESAESAQSAESAKSAASAGLLCVAWSMVLVSGEAEEADGQHGGLEAAFACPGSCNE